MVVWAQGVALVSNRTAGTGSLALCLDRGSGTPIVGIQQLVAPGNLALNYTFLDVPAGDYYVALCTDWKGNLELGAHYVSGMSARLQ